MTDKLLEQISALADDELDARETQLLLARFERDAELRGAWERYHLVGEAMRGGLAGAGRDSLAAGVAAALDDELPPAGRHVVAVRALLRPAAGFAVAVTVAVLAIFTVPDSRFMREVALEDGSEVVPSGRTNPALLPLVPAQQAGFSDVRSPELQNQLRSYLINYGEHSSGSRLRGVMPYVQIAAHGTTRVAEDQVEDAVPDTGDEPDYRYRNRR